MCRAAPERGLLSTPSPAARVFPKVMAESHRRPATHSMVLFMRATDPELAVYHQGLYESALDAGDLLTRCQAVLLIAPAGSYISHATAGRLQGLWVPNTAAIDVSVLPGRCRVMDSHFAVHRGRVDARVRTLAGLRVSDPIQVVPSLFVVVVIVCEMISCPPSGEVAAVRPSPARVSTA